MQIFVYEFVTDGGWSAVFDHHPPAAWPAKAGPCAMPWRPISRPRRLDRGGDARRAESGSQTSESQAFEPAARRADATVIIAPEFDEILATRHRWAAAVGARVLGCG